MNRVLPSLNVEERLCGRKGGRTLVTMHLWRSRALAVTLAFSCTNAFALTWPTKLERLQSDVRATNPIVRRGVAEDLDGVGNKEAFMLLEPLLADENIEVRVTAARTASRLGLPNLLDRAVSWLSDREPKLRIAGCNVFRDRPDPRHTAAVIRVLNDADNAVKIAAIEALVASKQPDVVAHLVGKLDDPTPSVRVATARALIRIGSNTAIVPLIGKAQDSSSDVRQVVLQGLGTMDDPRVSGPLVNALRDPQGEVRAAALDSIGILRLTQAQDTVASFLTDKDARVKQSAMFALERFGTRASAVALIARLGTSDDAPIVRALSRMHDNSVTSVLEETLRSTNQRIVANTLAHLLSLRGHGRTETLAAMRSDKIDKEVGLLAIGKLKLVEELGHVLESLLSEKAEIRIAAMAATDALLDPRRPDGRAVEPILEALAKTTLPRHERLRLLALLGKTGSPRASPPLVAFIRSSDLELQWAAIDAVATLGLQTRPDDELENALLQSMQSPESRTRLRAAVSLSAVGTLRALQLLRSALQEGRTLDRATTWIALEGMMARHATAEDVRWMTGLLDRTRGAERFTITTVLGLAGAPEASQALRNLAKSEDRDDRLAAARMISARRDLGDLAEILSRDPELSVREEAVLAFQGNVRGSIEGALRRVLDEGDLAAPNALIRLAIGGSSKACEYLASPNPLVRANVLRASTRENAACKLDERLVAETLENDPDMLVRQRAGEWLHKTPSSVSARALLQCRQRETNPEVAKACDEGAVSASSERTTALVFVSAESRGDTKDLRPIALERSDGFIQVAHADLRGAVFLSDVPVGPLRLRRR